MEAPPSPHGAPRTHRRAHPGGAGRRLGLRQVQGQVGARLPCGRPWERKNETPAVPGSCLGRPSLPRMHWALFSQQLESGSRAAAATSGRRLGKAVAAAGPGRCGLRPPALVLGARRGGAGAASGLWTARRGSARMAAPETATHREVWLGFPQPPALPAARCLRPVRSPPGASRRGPLLTSRRLGQLGHPISQAGKPRAILSPSARPRSRPGKARTRPPVGGISVWLVPLKTSLARPRDGAAWPTQAPRAVGAQRT